MRATPMGCNCSLPPGMGGGLRVSGSQLGVRASSRDSGLGRCGVEWAEANSLASLRMSCGDICPRSPMGSRIGERRDGERRRWAMLLH